MDAAEQYGVTGFPTVVFADASGKPFGGFVGGRSREDVMKAMQDALKNKEALQAAEANVARGVFPNSFLWEVRMAFDGRIWPVCHFNRI